MGQYYNPINLDKKEYLYSHDYDSGLKLMEHSWLGNNFVKEISYRLSKEELWKGNRIIWCGDYSDGEEPGKLIWLTEEQMKAFYNENDEHHKKYGINPYDLCHNPKYDANWTEEQKKLGFKISDKIEDVYLDHMVYRYLVNHDEKTFVDLTKCPSCNDWIVHPLPLLTCTSNGRGGGDYHDNDGDENYVGIWAGHRLSIEKVTLGYDEIFPNFYERYGNETVIFYNEETLANEEN